MFRLSLILLALSAFAASAQSIRDDLWVTNGFVYGQTLVGNTLYLGGAFTRIGPATGGCMPTDLTTGLRTRGPLDVDGAVYAIVADGSGNFVIGGSFRHYQGVPRSNIAKIAADGTLLAWDPGVNGVVRSLAIGGGRVYIGGAFSSVGGIARSNLACVDLTSWAVQDWAPNADNTVYYVGFLNNLVYVGGEFFGIAGTQRAHAGSFDWVTGAATNWQPNPDGAVYTMALRYDVINLTTSVYMGGSFTVCGGAFRNNFALVDATPNAQTFGSALNFDPSPNGTVRVIRTIGNTIPTIYVGGDFQTIAGQSRRFVAAFTGTTLKTFNPNPDGAVYTLALSGSNLFMGGLFHTVDQALRAYGAAVSTSTGVVQPWDAAAGGMIRAFAQDGTATMWIGGDFTTIGALNRSNLAAIDLSTGAATGWSPVAAGPVYTLEAIGSWIYAGGQFPAVGGQGHLNLARIDTGGNADAAWNISPNLPVYAIAGRSLGPSGFTLYFGGPFTLVNGVPRNHLAAVTDAAPTLLQPWNPNAGTPGDVRAIAIDGSNVYVGGTFGSMNGLGIVSLARLDFNNGIVDQGWVPQPTKPIVTLTLAPTTVYVGFPGGSGFIGGPRIGVAELNKATPTVTAWNPSTDNGAAYAIRRNGNTVYIGGLFNVLGGQPRTNLGAVDAVTGLALPFDPAPSSWLVAANQYYQLPGVLDLEELGGKLYAAGQFTNADGKPHSGVVGIFESTVSAPVATAGVSLRAAPNPANGDQVLRFSMSAPGRAHVTIHDVSGRLVRVLVDEDLPAGPQRCTWNGRETNGARVAPGLYFVHFGKETAKLLRCP